MAAALDPTASLPPPTTPETRRNPCVSRADWSSGRSSRLILAVSGRTVSWLQMFQEALLSWKNEAEKLQYEAKVDDRRGFSGQLKRVAAESDDHLASRLEIRREPELEVVFSGDAVDEVRTRNAEVAHSARMDSYPAAQVASYPIPITFSSRILGDKDIEHSLAPQEGAVLAVLPPTNVRCDVQGR